MKRLPPQRHLDADSAVWQWYAENRPKLTALWPKAETAFRDNQAILASGFAGLTDLLNGNSLMRADGVRATAK